MNKKIFQWIAFLLLFAVVTFLLNHYKASTQIRRVAPLGILRKVAGKTYQWRNAVKTEANATPTCNTVTRTEECFLQTDEMLNPHNYEIKASNPNLCASAKVKLLILISSRVDDFDRRLTQRETWASIVRDPSQPVRIAFLLGNVSSEAVQEKVTQEFLKYEDVFQETFDDTYLNLTLKTVMLFRWAATFCPQAQWVMKTDTDVFVNVPYLLQYLKKQESPESKNSKKTLVGRIAHGGAPIRNPDSKWVALPESYPMSWYPSFAFGPCYVVSGDLPELLYEMSEKTPFFHLEDVWVGLLMKKLNGNYLHDEGFCNFHIQDSACTYRNIICGHDVSQDAMRKIWGEMKEMKEKNQTCN